MNFLESLKNILLEWTGKKRQYLFGEGINDYGEEELLYVFNSQGIYQDEFAVLKKSTLMSTILTYKEECLSNIREVNELNDINIEPNDLLRKQKYYEVPKNRISYIIASEKEGNSYLGETNGNDFLVPKSSLIHTPFQIIGKLSQKELAFSWFPFDDLFLVYPIFAEIQGFMYLDYSDPKSPKVFDADYEIGYPFGTISLDKLHRYEKVNIALLSIKNLEEFQELDFDYWNMGIVGVPHWHQHIQIPRCPKTGNFMKFVCQIDSSVPTKVSHSDVLKEDIPHIQNYSSLNFWGDGTLFVFMEPETKIVGYLIQSS